MDYNHWHAKLAAWTHDPAEKALVLLRDPTGHERGTVAELREAIFSQRDIPHELKPVVKRADHWASAADRPQWPRDEKDGRYPAWAQVRFTEQPVLKHPLSGEQLDLKKLSEIDVEAIKAVSLNHFRGWLDADGDAKKSALAFWRFGPGRPARELGHVWSLLPADTRVPDHTIWQHLDLTAAFATASHADFKGNPALLTISIGPVQDFIAQARTTSDLWAGSHLLARLAWEAMKVVCEAYGPDAVLFPQLRGVPQVDLWLRDEVGLPHEWFEGEEWMGGVTDSNPLFAAALPNRFVALVPASEADEIVARITEVVRKWVNGQAYAGLDHLLNHAGMAGADSEPAREQIKQQLDGFPEVHWAAVPWAPLVQGREGETPDTSRLEDALSVFYPEDAKKGFLDSNAWKLLSKALTVEGQQFYEPNPGTLYPCVYDLLDRAQAAAKSVRQFAQLPQEGYRCSLCGEREWLTHDRALLHYSPRQQQETFWNDVQGTSLARKGEHLCALCMLKRVWPSLFAQEAGKALGRDGKLGRYVVSTHTMALATSLERWLEQPNRNSLPENWLSQLEAVADQDTVALPRKLARRLPHADRETRAMLRGLPLFLERRKEELQGDDASDREMAEQLGEQLANELKDGVLDHKPEAYYALILMDGDRMGAWLSGQGEAGEALRLPFEETWHPQLRETLGNRHREGDLAAYRAEKRPVSPARHMAISTALNAFSLHIARYVVEEIGKGKVIYSGGDDVLAMVSVDDLLSVMLLLRLAYSGLFPTENARAEKAESLLAIDEGRLKLRRGHALLNNRLYRMMGHAATASVGAVVAHHQAPLGQVLRRLRAAEQRAKTEGGRDAFAIELLKRSGGAVHLTCPWVKRAPGELSDWQEAMKQDLETTPMGQLVRLRDRFAGQDFSRRAAYITQGWLANMPEDSASLRAMLAYQFRRQNSDQGTKKVLGSLGDSLAELALTVAPDKKTTEFVESFLAVAEFLAREGRVRGSKANAANGKSGKAA